MIRLDSLSWKGIGAFFLFVAALSAWSWSGILLVQKAISLEEHAEYLLSILQRNLLVYFPIYLAVAIADGLPLSPARRNVVLFSALVAGTLLAVQVRCAAMPSQLLYVYSSVSMPYCDTFPTWRTYWDFPSTFLTPLTVSAAVLVFFTSRRRDEELVARLHATRTAQVETRRQRVESEIEAMRSRMDPDGLMDTLRSIRSRYEADPDDGERRLDHLIQRLREAAGRQPGPAGAE
jgi:hypothetical protein